jgi:hypothetical protein
MELLKELQAIQAVFDEKLRTAQLEAEQAMKDTHEKFAAIEQEHLQKRTQEMDDLIIKADALLKKPQIANTTPKIYKKKVYKNEN